MKKKTRREFLQAGSGLLAAAPFFPRWIQSAVAQIEASAPEIDPRSRILVLVDLAGGNDGLNTVVPYADDLYQKARPVLALKEKEILKIEEGTGLHPSLKALLEVWEAGQLAVLRSVGYPNMNRSHFEASEIYQSAALRRTALRGWVGQLADRGALEAKESQSVLPRLCRIGQSTPIAFLTDRAGSLALDNAQAFELRSNDRAQPDRPALLKAMQSIYDVPRDNPVAEKLQRALLEAHGISDRLKKAAQSYEASGYPNQPLGNALKLVAQMIHGEFGVKAYYVSLGGFDTHANQKNQHANLLTQLGSALLAFQKDLAEHGHAEQVLTLTFSEFGRRLQENGSQGTDHGTTIPMFALGGKVKGGIYGKAPNLADLDRGDPKHDLDFRQVYASVIERWWGAESQPVLGERFEPVPFLSA